MLPYSEIYDEYIAGVSVRELAEKHGISISSIYSCIKKACKQRGTTFVSNKVKQHLEIYNEYIAGVSVRELAEKHGISISSIYSYIKKACKQRGITFKMACNQHMLTTFVNNKEKHCLEIYDEYTSGVSASDLAEKYGTSRTSIYNCIKKVCKQRGIAFVSNNEKQSVSLKLKHESIVSEFLAGSCIGELAEKYEMPHQEIKRILTQNGIEWKKNLTFFDRHYNTTLPIEQIIGEYEAKKSTIKQIAQKYGVGTPYLYKLIFDYYNETGKSRPFRRKKGCNVNKLPHEQIVKLYESGMSSPELAKKYDATVITICKILRMYDVEQRRCKMTVLSTSEKEAMLAEYNKGVSYNKLAKKYHVRIPRVRTIISELEKENS